MPEVISDRKLMLQGQWPTDRGCEYCKNVEESGGISDRLYHNNDEGITPVDFDNDRLNVTPRIQEIYLNNTCDLACVYCVPGFSSKINDELKKYGPLTTMPAIKTIQKSPDQSAYLEKMLDWLEKNWHDLKRLSVQGGEPFLQKEFFVMLDHIKKVSNRDLIFSVNSNLNASGKIIEDFIPQIKQILVDRRIKAFHITASIDCWGPAQEFIRWGLDLKNWQKNFELLLNHRWIYVNTGQTITSLSIKTTPDLQRLFNGYMDQGYRFNQTLGYVDGHNQLLYDPIIFGGDFFKEPLEETLELMPSGTDQQRHVKDRMYGIVKYVITGKQDRERLSKLYSTLDQLDQRRGTDWKTLFPDVAKYFLDNEITYVV
jgi:pyruvate-formate lyase-activating enzyme